MLRIQLLFFKCVFFFSVILQEERNQQRVKAKHATGAIVPLSWGGEKNKRNFVRGFLFQQRGLDRREVWRTKERGGERRREIETLKTMSCSFIMCGCSAFVGGIVLLQPPFRLIKSVGTHTLPTPSPPTPAKSIDHGRNELSLSDRFAFAASSGRFEYFSSSGV